MTNNIRWIEEKTQNPEMCEKCGGRCCKRCGCSYIPSDIDMSFKSIMHYIKEGLMRVDVLSYWEDKKEKTIYYLRVANLEEDAKDSLHGYGQCIFLTPNGCLLSYEERPSMGKYLAPFHDGVDCYSLLKREEFIEAWLPWQELLLDVLNKVKMGY